MTTLSSASLETAVAAPHPITSPLSADRAHLRYSRAELLNVGRELFGRDVPPPTPELHPLPDPAELPSRLRSAIIRHVKSLVPAHTSFEHRRQLTLTQMQSRRDEQRYNLLCRCAQIERDVYADVEDESIADITAYCLEHHISKPSDRRFEEAVVRLCKVRLDTAAEELRCGLNTLLREHAL